MLPRQEARRAPFGAESITRYVRGAVKHDVQLRGPLPNADRADAEQQAHVELARLLGPGYHRLVGRDTEARPLSAEERLAVRKAVNRAIGSARWKLDKRKQRGLPVEVPLPGNPRGREVGRSQRATAGLVHLALDLRHVLAGLGELERRVWEGLRAGLSTRAIGLALGVRHQRVAEVRAAVLGRVAACLERRDAEQAPWRLVEGADPDPNASALEAALDRLGPLGERVWRGLLEGKSPQAMAEEFKMPLGPVQACHCGLVAALVGFAARAPAGII